MIVIAMVYNSINAQKIFKKKSCILTDGNLKNPSI